MKQNQKHLPFPPPLPFSPAQLHSRFSLPPHPEWLRGAGKGNCSQFIRLLLCCSFLLILFPCSSVGSLSWETILCKILQCESIPRAAALHELLQHGSLPQGAILQEQVAPAWVPHRVTSPARKHALVWAPLSMGPQVLAGACSSVGSPQGHTPFRHPLALGKDLHGLQVEICSTTDLRGLQRCSLPHQGLLHGLQGNLSSGTWSTPSSSFCTHLGVFRAVSLTYSHSLLTSVAQHFYPFINILSQRHYQHR